MNLTELLSIIASIVALLIAIVGHEIMHGWVAYKYGDNTAKSMGRLSINPFVHIDPMGSILVPAMTYFIPILLGGNGFLFGWAKPVPVNMQTVIRNGGYNAAMQVSLAGIVYNLFLATFFSIIFNSIHVPTNMDNLTYIFGFILIFKLLSVNLLLGIFNLFPIPGFDGSHFVSYLALKFKIYKIAEFFAKAESYGIVIIIIILTIILNTGILGWFMDSTLSLLLDKEHYEILHRN